MKTLLWIILVVLNVLLVLSLLNAIGYTMRRRRLQHLLSFKHKLEIHTATCGPENNPRSGYNEDEHIKQLQLTIYVNRNDTKSKYLAEVFCSIHNHSESFDITKAEFNAVSEVIASGEGKKA